MKMDGERKRRERETSLGDSVIRSREELPSGGLL